MTKDEMFEDKKQMARIIAFELCPQKYHKEWYGEYANCYADDNFADCATIKEVVDKLYNAKYCKVGEDEIVIKKSEYDILLKDYTITYGNAYQWGLKVGEEKTARDIFEDIEYYGVRSLNDKVWGNHFKLTDYTILDLKIKYGIAKEKGIELED